MFGRFVILRHNIVFIALLLTFLSFLLRIYLISDQPLRGDESFTIQFSARPLEQVFPEIATVEPNPPLYYLLFNWWVALTGQSEFSTRFFSLLFGVLCIPLVYRLGEVMGRKDVGLVAALLIGINPFQIWHSQDVRLYTLWPAITLFSFIFLILALEKKRSLYWMLYGLFSLAGLYTHYFHAFILLAQNIYFITQVVHWRPSHDAGDKRSMWQKWFALQGTLVLLYLPWLLITNRPTTYHPSGQAPEAFEVFPLLAGTFGVGETVPGEFSLLAGWLLILLSLLAVVAELRKEQRYLLLLLIHILIPALGVYLLSQWRPFFRERYLNALAPGFYLLWGYGLIAIRDRFANGRNWLLSIGLAIFALAAAYSLNNYWNDPAYAKSQNWPRLANFLEKNSGSGDVIIFNYPDPTLDYYYDGSALLLIVPHGFTTPAIKRETVETLWDLINRYQRIWLLPLRHPAWDKEGLVETWLNLHSRVEQRRSPAGFPLLLYIPELVGEEEIQNHLDLRLGDSLQLAGYTLQEEGPILSPGETLPLTLFWKALRPVEESYHVFVHLQDQEGRIVVQQDNPPQEGKYPTNLWATGELIRDEYRLIIPPDTPPRSYHLTVGLYLLDSGERLAVFDTQGNVLGDQITILEIEIE
ncbi:MAG: glycosyltransferase family 39 protein [Chloroflexi bacterium]|nr:glycosyltransferase family 39 protein [Chloroflexota bacterium]